MKISDLISDAALLFYNEDENRYYELLFEGEIVNGFTDAPMVIILKKGKRVYNKDIYDYKSDNITIENEGLVNLKKVCQKYNIPLSDVADVLEEYIVYDNAEYLEKLKQ